MRIAHTGSSPFVVMIATLALLPGLAAVLHYALDPGLREELGWHAAWLFLWCGVSLVLLGRALRRRYATHCSTPQHEPARTTPRDLAGPLTPF